MRRRFSPTGAALASATLLIGSLLAIAGASPADAAPVRSAKPPAAVEPSNTSSLPEEPKAAYSKAGPDGDAGCFTARRKLFVEGEGWIVRRVTTCR
jgi:hypothetical protein